jgi:superfamily I DNA/RNA helicase
MKLTDEQIAVVDACKDGRALVVEAGAGTGKTSTLRAAASAMAGRRILYLAYNKTTQLSAQRSFPRNVTAKTAHSLAHKALRDGHKKRLEKDPRVPLAILAARFGVDSPFKLDEDAPLTPAAMASMALATVERYCNSADDDLDGRHLRVPPRMRKHLEALAPEILPVARKMWADLVDPNGEKAKFDHPHYLKMWALTRPSLPYDVVQLDEAQDTNPVLAQVVLDSSAQKIAIGDGAQQLYAWRGAVDALRDWPGERLLLTQSWRYGQAIAERANLFLEALGSDLRVTGSPHIQSVVGPLADADATLCRSNAGTVVELIRMLEEGKSPSIQGGVDGMQRLARAAQRLQAGQPVEHPELVLFSSWDELRDYADSEVGTDLRSFVKLVDELGAERVIKELDRASAGDGTNVLSTVHKSKGLEYPSVRIAGDFEVPGSEGGEMAFTPIRPPEAMIAYVAVTRAQHRLDDYGLGWIDEYMPEHRQQIAQSRHRHKGWR